MTSSSAHTAQLQLDLDHPDAHMSPGGARGADYRLLHPAKLCVIILLFVLRDMVYTNGLQTIVAASLASDNCL